MPRTDRASDCLELREQMQLCAPILIRFRKPRIAPPPSKRSAWCAFAGIALSVLAFDFAIHETREFSSEDTALGPLSISRSAVCDGRQIVGVEKA